MATSVLQILIKLAKEGNADKEVIRGLKNLEAAFKPVMAAAGALGTAYVALDKVVIQNVNAFKTYALAMNDGARITGMAVDQYSRLVQAADDVRVAEEALTKSLNFATKSGFDTSIPSLMRMADEYQAITTATGKAEFLVKRFGKSGLEMGKLLELSGQGIKGATDAINDNMVVTAQAAKEAEAYNKALDDLSDAATGVNNTIGAKTMPVLTEWINKMQDSGVAWSFVIRTLKDNKALSDRANRMRMAAEAQGDHTKSMKEYLALAQQEIEIEKERQGYRDEKALVLSKRSVVGAQGSAAVEAEAKTYDNLYSSVQSITQINKEYAATVADVTQKKADLQAQIDVLKSQGYLEEGRAIQALRGEMGNLDAQLAASAKAREDASRRMVFAMEQQRLAADGLSEAEYNYLNQLGVAWGIIDQTAITQAENVQEALKLQEQYNLTTEQFAKVMDKIMKLPTNKHFDIEAYFKAAYEASTAGTGAAAGDNGLTVDNSSPNTGNNQQTFDNNDNYSTTDAKASGGQLRAGRWTLVGDRPGGRLAEYSELISPSGYVFNAKQTRALMASGKLGRVRALPTGGELTSSPHAPTVLDWLNQTGGTSYTSIDQARAAYQASLTGGGQQATSAEAVTQASQAAVSVSASAQTQTAAIVDSTAKISQAITSLTISLSRMATRDDIQQAMTSAVQLLN
jgi:hypothetical protein